MQNKTTYTNKFGEPIIFTMERIEKLILLVTSQYPAHGEPMKYDFIPTYTDKIKPFPLQRSQAPIVKPK